MSGDVQPRKRKDKKRKKDELGVEEVSSRGTAAVFGEGDVFMHSHHEHGTGGHWCAKIIFFSLLAVLVTLIGLIILENRGLTDLEANAVESRYSGVLEGWLEDAPDDDHHDEHTLELKHHGDEEDHDVEAGHEDSQQDDDDHGDDSHDVEEDEDDHDDEDHDEHDEDEEDDEEHQNDEDEQDDEDSQEEDEQQDDEDEDEDNVKYKYEDSQAEDDDDDEPDDEKDNEPEDDDEQSNEEANESAEVDDQSEEKDADEENDENQSLENANDDNSAEEANGSEEGADSAEQDEEEEEHEEEEEEGDAEVEVERIEREYPDEEPISTELPALPEADDDDDNKALEASQEIEAASDDNDDGDDDDDDSDGEEEFLEAEDEDEPLAVEHISAPPGKPLVEVEEDEAAAWEQPPDSLQQEEEYEQQQLLRNQHHHARHTWVRVGVGAALLAATVAVLRRGRAASDADNNASAEEEPAAREATPLTDRRMTLIPEEPSPPATPVSVVPPRFPPNLHEDLAKKTAPLVKTVPVPKHESEDEEDVEEINEEEIEITEAPKEVDKELYSDEEEVEEEEEEEEPVQEKKEEPKRSVSATEKKPSPEPEAEEEEEGPDDDVEIIDDELIEEEEEEGEEEEISDVDDAELLTRLEAKYGRLPEPERPPQRHKDGGNSIEEEWSGEPSDAYWRQQLDQAEEALRQGRWSAAEAGAGAAALGGSARARWTAARALDAAAEHARDNKLLGAAIHAYLHLLKLHHRLTDDQLLRVAHRAIDRIHFRGTYLSAEPVHRLLIRRFPDDPAFRNNLTVSFLMANRAEEAEEVVLETLRRWPEDRLALAHYGFLLKSKPGRLERAVALLQRALAGDAGPAAADPRFYYHLGDALLQLGRRAEADAVHERAAALGHFPSAAQRSLYNAPGLRARPWWDATRTPYAGLARDLEAAWRDILAEAEAARASYSREREGLRERGEWTQLELFVRGAEVRGRCGRARVTCGVVRRAAAAGAACRRGQVKFSALAPGSHVRAHVGPTNCRLRMHLALSNTAGAFIRVHDETRQWERGKVLMFDDSFEHEVWHNGTGTRLVLIVDVWHPDLTPHQRDTLPAI